MTEATLLQTLPNPIGLVERQMRAYPGGFRGHFFQPLRTHGDRLSNMPPERASAQQFFWASSWTIRPRKIAERSHRGASRVVQMDDAPTFKRLYVKKRPSARVRRTSPPQRHRCRSLDRNGQSKMPANHRCDFRIFCYGSGLRLRPAGAMISWQSNGSGVTHQRPHTIGRT